MVDNVISASKCGSTTVTLNACINSFMKRKKLSISADKCSRIHIGTKTKTNECALVKVNNEEMKSSGKLVLQANLVLMQSWLR